MLQDLSTPECEDVLSKNRYGHLGCCVDNEPYVVPITYAYRDGSLYSFTHEGKKTEIMRKNPKVCVQVEAIDGARNWKSVMCWGRYEQLTDPKEIQETKLLLADAYGKSIEETGKEPVDPPLSHLNEERGTDNDIVYRIRIEKMTGKADTRH